MPIRSRRPETKRCAALRGSSVPALSDAKQAHEILYRWVGVIQLPSRESANELSDRHASGTANLALAVGVVLLLAEVDDLCSGWCLLDRHSFFVVSARRMESLKPEVNAERSIDPKPCQRRAGAEESRSTRPSDLAANASLTISTSCAEGA